MLPTDLVAHAISSMDSAHQAGTMLAAPSMEMNAAEVIDALATSSSTMQPGNNRDMSAAETVNAPATSSSTWQSGPNVEMDCTCLQHLPPPARPLRRLQGPFLYHLNFSRRP